MKSVHREFPSFAAQYRRALPIASSEALNPGGNSREQARQPGKERNSTVCQADPATSNPSLETL